MDLVLFQNYSNQSLSADQRAALDALCAHHTPAQLLKELIDTCKKRAGKNRPDQSISLSDDEIELLLIRILADNIHKKDARVFLNGLTDSLFFEKVMNVMQIAATPEVDTVDEMAEIRIQSSEEILRRLRSNESEPAKIPFVTWLIDKLRHWPLDWKWVSVPAAALATLALAIILPYQNHTPNTLYVKYLDDAEEAIHIKDPSFNFLRGTRASADAFDPYDSLITRYKNAFGLYLVEDYKSALKEFNELENKVNALDKSKANAYLKSEFYFYLGQCHLQLAGSRGLKKKHLENAINDFSKSLELAQEFDFGHKLQVPFYLALAYHMNGEQHQSSKVLTTFNVSPQYRADAEHLKSIK